MVREHGKFRKAKRPASEGDFTRAVDLIDIDIMFMSVSSYEFDERIGYKCFFLKCARMDKLGEHMQILFWKPSLREMIIDEDPPFHGFFYKDGGEQMSPWTFEVIRGKDQLAEDGVF